MSGSGTIDPIVTSESVRESYVRYLRSLFSVRDAPLARALERAIEHQSALTKGPILEATPPYATGATLGELIKEGVLSQGLGGICTEALPLNRPLYVHQEHAIRKVVAGRNVVVATGTGSGKTESFLIPILDSLSREHAAGTLGPGVRAL